MPTWVGIDVGRTAVKVVAVKSAYRKLSIDGIGVVEIASDPGGTAGALKNAVAMALRGKIAADGSAAALDGVKAAVKFLSIPLSAQKQLNDVLRYELESQVPFDMDHAVFDYRVLPRVQFAPNDPAAPSAAEAAMLSLVAVVARIDDVRERIELVRSSTGLEPERIGVGAFPLASLSQCIPALAEPSAVAVLDFGTRSTELVVVRGGEPIFARTLSSGTEGLPGSAAKLARELRLSLNAFRAQGGEPVTRVLLAGGGAFVSGADVFLGRELGIAVELMPPPALDVTGLAEDQVRSLPRFAKALGLALALSGRAAPFNLRKGPLTYERGFAWVREKVPMLAGLAAVILVSFAFSAWARLYSLSKEKETLENALKTVTGEVLGEATTSASQAQSLAAQTQVTDEDPMPHADSFDVMVKISEAIPQSMKHDIEDLDIQKAHVIVHGIVGTIPDAQSIATSLRSERCFSDVKITRTNQQPGSDRQKYVMELDLKCPEDIKGAKKKDSASTSPASSSSGGK